MKNEPICEPRDEPKASPTGWYIQQAHEALDSLANEVLFEESRTSHQLKLGPISITKQGDKVIARASVRIYLTGLSK